MEKRNKFLKNKVIYNLNLIERKLNKCTYVNSPYTRFISNYSQ